jgi:hypothetical protein
MVEEKVHELYAQTYKLEEEVKEVRRATLTSV